MISTSPAIFRWQPACWMRVTGEDAATFLQGQFTNDLRALTGAGATYGLWLTLKGKVLADSFVLRGAEANEFWIGSYFSPAAVIRERLESHVIADDVTIEDETSAWTGLSVFGSSGGELTDDADAEGFRFRGRRERAENYEWVYRRAIGEPAGMGGVVAGAREISADDVERRRIAAVIPAIPVDVGLGDLPNEAGLEAEAISFTKGCYLGQEVMARLKSMGQVRRRLVRVAGVGEPPAVRPASVFTTARQVGEVRSAVSDGAGGWIGLAMVSRLQVAGVDALSLALGAEPTVRLQEAP